MRLVLMVSVFFVLNLRAQDYSWKISGNVAPVHVFFDGSPVFMVGHYSDFHLRSLTFFKNQFKESRGLSISKLWKKHQVQLAYNYYGNSYAHGIFDTHLFPMTDIRVYKDYSLNYLHQLEIRKLDRFKLFIGGGLSHRRGREERLYGYGQLGTISYEALRYTYVLKDLGVNLICRLDYRFFKKMDVFFETKLYTNLFYGDKSSQVYFKENFNSDFRPARCDLSFGFGLSYNFNFKKANQLSGAEILPPFKNRN